MTIASPITPVPPSLTMTTGETVPVELDTTPLGGGTVLTASAALKDLSVGRGTNVAGLPSLTISAPNLIQSIPGSLLTAGHIYRLTFTWSPVSGTTWQQLITIYVPA